MFKKIVLALWKYTKNRFKERSTRVGLSVVLGAVGVAVSPDQLEAIATIGAIVTGGIEAAMPD